MTIECNLEAGHKFDKPPKATSIFRRAGGEPLETLFGELAGLSISGLQLPRGGRDGTISPVLALVKKKELSRILHLLHPSVASSRARRIELAKRIPALTLPRTLIASALDNHQSHKGGPHYLALRFDEETSLEVGEERADIWHALEEISGLEEDKLEWRDYNPDLRLIVAGDVVPESVVTSIATHIRNQLPMQVDLEYAVDPTILD